MKCTIYLVLSSKFCCLTLMSFPCFLAPRIQFGIKEEKAAVVVPSVEYFEVSVFLSIGGNVLRNLIVSPLGNVSQKRYRDVSLSRLDPFSFLLACKLQTSEVF